MKYFAYGSNMDPDRMKKRCINFTSREHAILEDWELVFNKVASKNDMEGYAKIKTKKGDITEGILYTIQDSDIKILDRYEGFPEYYVHKTIVLKFDNKDKVEAITYIANHKKIKEGLKPSREYLTHLLIGCDLLSEEYCEKLKKIETLD